MRRRHVWIWTVLLAALACQVWAEWPQYLGPNRNATSAQEGLARSWPEGGPKVLWAFPLGEGYGGAAVSAGKVYLIDRVESKREFVRCLDLVSGREEWNYSYEAPGRLSHPGSRSVPAVDGDYVYTCGAHGDLYCVDKNTHKPAWKKNIWKDYGGAREPTWGISQNPLVYGDLLIVASQTPKAGIVAYDKKTGEEKWASPPLPGSPGYVSPKIIKIAGQDHLVMVTAKSRGGGGRPPRRGGAPGQRRRPGPGRDRMEPGPRGPRGFDREERARPPRRPMPPGDRRPPRRPGGPAGPERGEREQMKGAVVGIDPKTGRTLWTYEGWQCQTPVPGVTAVGDDRLFVTGGYGAGSAMFQVQKKEDDSYGVRELLTTQDFGTHVHPAILYKDHLYAHCSDNWGRYDGMACMDLKGNVKWKTARSPVFDKGGFILVDDLILSIDGREGILYLIEPNPEGFKPLASAKMLDTRDCWAPLALTDGKLLIRDQKQMKCVVVR